MGNRTKDWRIHKSKCIQKKRRDKWASTDSQCENNTPWYDRPSAYGSFRKSHMGCGCWMCKPWKHGIENKYKFSEIRKIKDYEPNED